MNGNQTNNLVLDASSPRRTCDIPFDSVAALRRTPRSHKGTYGTVAVIAGSMNMAGAAYLCAKAAYSCGAGLVRIITPECNRVILQTLLPEAVLFTYTERTEPAEILSQLRTCTSAVLGPGLGKSETSARIVTAVLECSAVPLVLDADGINLACARLPIAEYKGRLIMTPHFGEASRLLDRPAADIADDPPSALLALYRRYGHTVLLKDMHTLIGNSAGVYVNESGCDGLSKGGTGDVLAGMIGALIRGADSDEAFLRACSYGAYLHGLAGERAAKKHGKHAMLASHVIDEIGNILSELDQRSDRPSISTDRI